MKTLYLTVVAGMMVPSGASTYAQDCQNLTGDWKTNLGATVRFEQIDPKTGQIAGSYFPASQPDRAFPLTGFYNPNGRVSGSQQHYAPAVSFTVSFAEFGGITNWSGTCHMTDGSPRLETEDLIIAPMADYVWSHVIANHDTLVPK